MRAGLWPDKYALRVGAIFDTGLITDQNTAAMAPFPSFVTRAVNTRTSLACVLNLCSTLSLSDVDSVADLSRRSCHTVVHERILDQQRRKQRGLLGGTTRVCVVSPRLMASQHEWAAHGTCYSTLEPPCLPTSSHTGAEAVAFFERVVALFQTLPTYAWLESQGITPSTTETHTLSELNSALEAASGVRHRPVSPVTRY